MHPGKTISDAIWKYETENDTDPTIQSTCKRLDREFGNIKMSDLSPDTVNMWKIKRLKEAAPATVLREIVTLKRIFNLAETIWEWVDHSRIRVVKNPKVRNDRVRHLSQEEEDALVASCPSWLANVVIFAIQTGMRRGEIINMRWQDIHDGVVMVEKNKEGRPKAIPLTPKAKSVLASILPGEGFVFLNEQGEKISASHIEYHFRLSVSRARLHNLHLHDLRHTCASRLISRSTPLYQVQALLGHRSPVTTARYAHLATETLRQALSESL